MRSVCNYHKVEDLFYLAETIHVSNGSSLLAPNRKGKPSGNLTVSAVVGAWKAAP